jgi:hypothetical protein
MGNNEPETVKRQVRGGRVPKIGNGRRNGDHSAAASRAIQDGTKLL